ncbi:hypothetical protein ALHIDCOG_00160 [Klebsiella phage CPRSB]|nr:hypothetical protein ALHIDCOG_00160 [Klebsiella phage CPRSB]
MLTLHLLVQLKSMVVMIGTARICQNQTYTKTLANWLCIRLKTVAGYLSGTNPVCDARIRQAYNQDTGAFTNIDYYWNGNRIAYMKHDETGAHQCKYTGMQVNTNADTSIPPVPPAMPSTYGALPSELSRADISCIPATVGFAYTNISDAMLQAWNKPVIRSSYSLTC